jgi:putative endonuclease
MVARDRKKRKEDGERGKGCVEHGGDDVPLPRYRFAAVSIRDRRCLKGGQGAGMMSGIWWVYMIECRGGKIYTGIAKDPDSRYRLHQSGNGAAYTRMNPPMALLGKRPCGSRSDALREERALRRLSGMEKRVWAEECGRSP